MGAYNANGLQLGLHGAQAATRAPQYATESSSSLEVSSTFAAIPNLPHLALFPVAHHLRGTP
jgi:hypothetical protein